APFSARREGRMSRRSARGEGPTAGLPETVYLMIDPETREAYRLGEGPTGCGPLVFTTRDRLHEYARQAGIAAYEVIKVPGYVLSRLRGKPHWVDGEARS